MINKNIISVIMTLNENFLTINNAVKNSAYIFTIFYLEKGKLFKRIIQKNRQDELKIIISYIDPSYDNNYAIIHASQNG